VRNGQLEKEARELRAENSSLLADVESSTLSAVTSQQVPAAVTSMLLGRGPAVHRTPVCADLSHSPTAVLSVLEHSLPEALSSEAGALLVAGLPVGRPARRQPGRQAGQQASRARPRRASAQVCPRGCCRQAAAAEARAKGLQEELTATYKDKARTADELLAAGRQLQVVRESNEAQARGPPPRAGCQPRVGRRERGASPPKQPLGAPSDAACSMQPAFPQAAPAAAGCQPRAEPRRGPPAVAGSA